ncbi:MAG TPA: aminopeptidase P family protein [Candidatus Ozemobacteraceae bacterium]|nr:aminopeptidase P family protein [Candidatus Ozemobacteraceae bacterium]
MFPAATYSARRRELRARFGNGLLLFPGNGGTPMNYAANTYAFRQDSSFLYYWGLAEPGLFAVVDLDLGREIVFGDDITLDDEIWMGPCAPLSVRAASAGVTETEPLAALEGYLAAALCAKRPIRFLPPYRAETKLQLERLLGIAASRLSSYASAEFIRAVVAQRIVKSPEEVAQIEAALEISGAMYGKILQLLRPDTIEQELVGAAEGVVLAAGSRTSFPTILSIRGETLHNHHHGNRMKAGDLLLVDSGAESPLCYASDITRTFPVSGRFEPRQKEIYEIVLAAQTKAIEMMRPGVSYRDVHLSAAKVIAEGLTAVGLMRGDPAAAVAAGAHALFFPHGLGHALGLDVHDMEGLGETYVGYDEEHVRSDQFGLAYLRFARRLEVGHVMTVEPGIYFIPTLIAVWKKEAKHAAFIDYAAVERYAGFGGIRIEDDVLITPDGRRVLGPAIPKTVAQIESALAQ